MAGVLVGRDQDEVDARERAILEAFGDAPTGEAWLEERRDALGLGTPDQARAQVRRFADAGMRADHAPGLPALGPRHDRRHGRGARRPRLAGRPRVRPARRRRRPRGRRSSRRIGSGLMPRARASRSVRSWRGTRCRAARPRGRGGRPPRRRQAAGRRQVAGTSSASTPAARIAAGPVPMIRAARSGAERARQALGRLVAIGQDQDEPGLVARSPARCPCRNVSRSR